MDNNQIKIETDQFSNEKNNENNPTQYNNYVFI